MQLNKKLSVTKSNKSEKIVCLFITTSPHWDRQTTPHKIDSVYIYMYVLYIKLLHTLNIRNYNIFHLFTSHSSFPLLHSRACTGVCLPSNNNNNTNKTLEK